MADFEDTVKLFAGLIVVSLLVGWGAGSVAQQFVPITGSARSEAEYIVYYNSTSSRYLILEESTQGLVGNSTAFGTAWAGLTAAWADGDLVHIKNGAYPTAVELDVDKAVTIEGTGYDCTVTATATIDSVFHVTASYAKIRDLTVDADNKAGICVWVNGGSRCEFTQVEAKDAISNCFEVSYAPGGVPTQRTGSKFDRCIGGGAGFANFYIGEDQTDNWITGCTAKDDYSGTDAGICLDGDGSQIMNNHLWGNKYGMWLAPNNTITKTSIVGNYIEGNTDANIYSGGSSHSVWDCSISSNVFWSNAADRPEYDILFDVADPYYSNRNAIIGNSFVGQGNYADYGIYFGSRAQANTVSGNTFNGFHIVAIYGQGNNYVSHNVGWLTEAHGNAVIPAGQNHVHITHGLPFIPAPADFNINLAEELLTAGNSLGWVVLDGDGSTGIIAYIHETESEDISITWAYSKTPYEG